MPSPSSSTSTPVVYTEPSTTLPRRSSSTGSPPTSTSKKTCSSPKASDGSIVGYGDVGESGDSVWLDVRAFDARACRAALLETLERIAHEKKPGARLLGFVAEKDTGLRSVYEERGYEVIRHSYRMEIDAPRPPR